MVVSAGRDADPTDEFCDSLTAKVHLEDNLDVTRSGVVASIGEVTGFGDLLLNVKDDHFLVIVGRLAGLTVTFRHACFI